MIRDFKDKDITPCVQLMADLGYPTDEQSLQTRWRHLLQQADYHLLVVEENHQVLGFVGFHKMYFFETDGAYFRILALVVSSEHRRKGLATKLLDAVSDFARAEGCRALALNSGLTDQRSGAHQFYKQYGFSMQTAGFTYRLIEGDNNG
ncbi:GNAT family N-acetyltransferase [Streptococcus suis]|nr:GNAT family N-acetyltransferase [Streptococcus suis]